MNRFIDILAWWGVLSVFCLPFAGLMIWMGAASKLWAYPIITLCLAAAWQADCEDETLSRRHESGENQK